jgi:purine nucleosidase
MSKLVLMDHDGGIDDLLSQLLLMTMEAVEVLAITVTPADCFIEPALESGFKLLQFLDKEHIPLGRGEYYGINAFPNQWRARPEVVNALPMLINLAPAPDPYSHPAAVDLMIDTLARAPGPVSILLTGPCSNLVFALEKAPQLRAKITQVVWMAGAFRVGGNVVNYQHNGTAEWNAYWDPVSTQKLVQWELPLVFIPLDVTNHVPVTKSFLSRLAAQSQYPLSHLAGQMWATTIDTIPSYHYTYYMWDILATSYLAIPQAFTTTKVKAKVSSRPPNAGQTYLDQTGWEVQIATAVNRDDFYAFILSQFRR